jgi:hypothetical protein
VTSRCSPQHCGHIRPWTAGQKRFSLRISQIEQLNREFSDLSLSHAERPPESLPHGPNIAILELEDVKNLSSCTFSYTSGGKTA